MGAPSGPRFDAPDGEVVGYRAGDVVRATGIKYADARRFRPPVPRAPSPVPILATRPSPACVQLLEPAGGPFGDAFAGVRFEEECQYLSVTAPGDARAGEGLPVMVWIHGGSYVSGGGDLPLYDPALLVVEQRVVVVAVTYRLGVLGYLGAGEHGAANLGLLDQVEALRWVRRNIAAFGGDPDRVTVFGESAGGDAVAHLLVSEGARGLFRRAVVQSAPLGIRRRRSRMTRLVLAAAGHLDEHAPVHDVVARQVPAHAAARRFGLRAGMPFGVQYGSDPLPPEREVEAAWRAAARDLDVLIGSTAEEATLFLPPPRRGGVPVVGAAARRALVRFGTDVVFTRPAHRLAALLAGAGARVTEYRVTWRPSGSRFGATHGVELPLLFESGTGWRGAAVLGSARPEEVHRAGVQVRRAWGEFARTGAVTAVADPAVLRTRPLPR